METQETKVCRRCGQERPIGKFTIGKTLKRGSVCFFCLYDREKEKKEQNKKFWFDDWIYGKV